MMKTVVNLITGTVEPVPLTEAEQAAQAQAVIDEESRRVAGYPDAVNAEASRRILAYCPEWKQRNLTAQAVQLTDKGRENWTEEELTAWDAGMGVWAHIAAIRAASNVLIVTPVHGYADDTNWPENPL